jgi:PRC-barrel domain
MNEVFGIFAPMATMAAAMITAANLGARATGWGFVVFTVGSTAWCAVAVMSGQRNLLLTNAFLVLVNIFGVWRWLGRVARHEDGARAAESKSKDACAPTLISVSSLVGRKVVDDDRASVGSIIGLMAETDSGMIAFAIVGIGGVGGIGERLVAIEWTSLAIEGDEFHTSLDKRQIARCPTVAPDDWPIAPR